MPTCQKLHHQLVLLGAGRNLKRLAFWGILAHWEWLCPKMNCGCCLPFFLLSFTSRPGGIQLCSHHAFPPHCAALTQVQSTGINHILKQANPFVCLLVFRIWKGQTLVTSDERLTDLYVHPSLLHAYNCWKKMILLLVAVSQWSLCSRISDKTVGPNQTDPAASPSGARFLDNLLWSYTMSPVPSDPL